MNDNAALRLLYLGLPPIGEQEPTALPFSPEALAASPLALTAADLATIPALFAAAWTERDDGGNRADTPDAGDCSEAGAEADAIDSAEADAVAAQASTRIPDATDSGNGSDNAPAPAFAAANAATCASACAAINAAASASAPLSGSPSHSGSAASRPGSAGPDALAWTPKEKNGVRWLEIPAPGLPAPVYITGPATSTLDVARLLVEADLFPEWASVLSLRQSAGRGQMRRAWASPEGNLYSALRRPLAPPCDSAAAAPACGSLFAEALSREHCPVLLKWPNDILQPSSSFRPGVAPGRNDCSKVGGMLMEERHGALIVGTGFNLVSCPPNSMLRDNYAFSAGVLRRASGFPLVDPACAHPSQKDSKSKDIVTIFTLWIRLASRLFSCYSQRQTLEPWWPALAQRHLAFRGCRVTLADACPERETMVRIPCEGVVDGVTESGALRLSTAFGTETFLGGSILPAGQVS